MRIKPAYLYQLSSYIVSVAVFYAVIIVLSAVLNISFFSVGYNGSEAMTGGFDGATAMFLFVTSLFVFREPFLMLMQNSVSRKTLFVSRLLVTGSIAFSMAVIDMIILLLKTALWSARGISIYSVFDQTYPGAMTQSNELLHYANIFVFDVLLYLSVIAAGYVITILFYRLNKAGKIAVGVGVPILLFFIYPLIDQSVFNAKLSGAVNNFLHIIFGLTTGSPHIAMLTLIIAFMILTVLSWLLMRRAIVKMRL